MANATHRGRWPSLVQWGCCPTERFSFNIVLIQGPADTLSTYLRFQNMCKLNAVVALEPRSTLFTKVAGGLDELEARVKADHYNNAADCYGFNAQKQAQLDESSGWVRLLGQSKILVSGPLQQDRGEELRASPLDGESNRDTGHEALCPVSVVANVISNNRHKP